MTKTNLMIGESSNGTARGFLSLAASPTFAIMALVTGALHVGPPDMLCAATQHASPLDGMVVMYALMSAFHSAPWLKLISSRRNGSERPELGDGGRLRPINGQAPPISKVSKMWGTQTIA